jgi:hypothetical protein
VFSEKFLTALFSPRHSFSPWVGRREIFFFTATAS